MQGNLEFGVRPIRRAPRCCYRFARFDLHGPTNRRPPSANSSRSGKTTSSPTVTDWFCSLPGLMITLVLALVAGLQLADNTVMLELLADRPCENRAH